MSTVRHKPSPTGGSLGRKNNASCGDRALPSVRLSATLYQRLAITRHVSSS
jgi:hypothetical protein